MQHLTEDERGALRALAADLVEAATPGIIAIVQQVEVQRAKVGLNAAYGELKEFEPIQQRDYRKQMWIAAFCSPNRGPVDERALVADMCLAEFDKRFPK